MLFRYHYYMVAIFSVLLLGCHKDTPHQNSTDIAAAQSAQLCNFYSGNCIKNSNNMAISLRISPYNTPSKTPLTVLIETEKPVTELTAKVEGRDMSMGVIPIVLSQIDKSNYSGQLIFGSCSSDFMVWRLHVNYRYQDRSYSEYFDFLADAP